MSKTVEAIEFLCAGWQDLEGRLFVSGPLSVDNLMMLLYLSDWRAAIQSENPITHSRWEFHMGAAWSDDVVGAIKVYPHELEVFSFGGTPSVRLSEANAFPQFSELLDTDKDALTFVLSNVARQSFSEVVSLVMSTWPFRTGSRFSTLDLAELAREYRRISGSWPQQAQHELV